VIPTRLGARPAVECWSVPAELLEAVVAKTMAINQREARIDADLQNGLSLSEAAGKNPLSS